jgi:hypothetical protein
MGTSLVVQPFASLVDRVPPDCPRLLINREKVVCALCAECSCRGPNKDIGPGQVGRFADSADAFAEGGLRYDDEDNYRDAVYLGACDEGVRRLAALLGWSAELDALVAQHGSAWPGPGRIPRPFPRAAWWGEVRAAAAAVFGGFLVRDGSRRAVTAAAAAAAAGGAAGGMRGLLARLARLRRGGGGCDACCGWGGGGMLEAVGGDEEDACGSGGDSGLSESFAGPEERPALPGERRAVSAGARGAATPAAGAALASGLMRPGAAGLAEPECQEGPAWGLSRAAPDKLGVGGCSERVASLWGGRRVQRRAVDAARWQRRGPLWVGSGRLCRGRPSQPGRPSAAPKRPSGPGRPVGYARPLTPAVRVSRPVTAAPNPCES